MGVKKSKPPALSRLHEMKVHETFAKTQKAVLSSRQRIRESKILKESTRQIIEESRQRKKK
jgi:translation initiation factor 2 beta subunit (eIF-2beta)/eIF-5